MADGLGWTLPSRALLDNVFSPELVYQLTNTTVDTEVIPWARFVYNKAYPLASEPIDITFPASLQHFLRVLDRVLSPYAKSCITGNISRFNELAQENTEHFLSILKFSGWLAQLCGVFFPAQSPSTMASSTSSGFGTSIGSSNPFSGFSSSASSPPSVTPGYGSLDKSFDGANDFVKVETMNRIIQVNLQGHNIKTAWASNDALVDKRWKGTSFRKLNTADSMTWKQTPRDAGSFPVFHGTSAHFKPHFRKWPMVWYNDVLNLTGNSGKCQMNPPGVNSVYTGFSGLRCFLWAAFQGDLYQNLPNAANVGFMNRDWSVNDQQFKGVAVFVFQVQIPSPGPGVPHFVMPDGRDEAFSQKVRHMQQGGDILPPTWQLDEAWKHLAPTHGSNIPSWPGALHCQEFGMQQSQLSSFSGNKWRTLWTGPGIAYLNDCYQYTMAISFTQTAPPPKPALVAPAPPRPNKKDDEQDKDRDEDKDRRKKKSGFFHAVKRRLSQRGLGGGSSSKAS